MGDTMKHRISTEDAAQMIQRRPSRGWAFDREILDAMLALEGAAGIRIYRGYTSQGVETPVVVAIGKDGHDLLEIIAEEATPCPPYCDRSSPLHG